MNTADTRAALDAAEQNATAAHAALDLAEENLRAAVEGQSTDGPALAALRSARAEARTAKTVAEEQLGKAEASHTRALAEEAAEEKRQADTEAAEEARRVAEEEARELAARLAGPLATLAEAKAKADDANGQIAAARAVLEHPDPARLVALALGARTESEGAEIAALVRGTVAAEQLLSAVEPVTALDPRRHEIGAAKAQAGAMAIHAIMADVSEGVALLSAARAMVLAALDRLEKASTVYGAREVARLAGSAAQLRAAANPLPPVAAGAPIGAWLGVGATEAGALATVVGNVSTPPHVTPAELARMILDGRAHEVYAISAERDRAAHLAALAAASSNDRGGPIARAQAATEELRHGRTTGQWYGGDPEARAAALRDIIRAGVAFISPQIISQAVRRPRGPFHVTTFPGIEITTEIPDLSEALPPAFDRPGGNAIMGTVNRRTPAAPAREQIAAFLGVDLARDDDLVPDFGDEPHEAAAPAQWPTPSPGIVSSEAA